MTEWRAGARDKTERWAASRGMRCAFVNDGATLNGLCVAALEKFRAMSATPGRETPGALLKAEFESWLVLACYFPQMKAKARYFEVLRNATRDSGWQPLLIVGDMNTGNQVADRTPNGERYARSEDFDGLSRVEGLVDLWRRSNGAEERQWTWLTRQNGFRIDHAFANPPFVDRFRPICRYDHTPRDAGFSDHSAIVIEMEGESAKAIA